MHFTAAPVLKTERLALRPYQRDDFEAFAAYFGSPRSIYTDGPVSRTAAWDLFTAGAGRWVIAGHGAWAIERQADKQPVGVVSLNTAIELPEPELGWILWDGFEGKGYASEAVKRVRQFAFETLKWTRLISGIHQDNERSINLAKRLGAVRDDSVRLEGEPETLFYRHHPD
ncbi:MAG: GNAT family N-acetyltransferase [Henriciella sp.]|nr:GNAT family N-acetyltransferase [Henriciella sp.]